MCESWALEVESVEKLSRSRNMPVAQKTAFSIRASLQQTGLVGLEYMIHVMSLFPYHLQSLQSETTVFQGREEKKEKREKESP